MKEDLLKHNRFLRFTGLTVVILFGILTTLGSGGGGDDVEGTPQGSVTAFNFTAGNTFTAAQLAASAMSFFPAFTKVGYVTLTGLLTPVPSGTDLLICANTPAGTSILSWKDVDSNGVLSIGDTALLTFDNCNIDGSGALAAGTLSISITNVIGTPPTPTSVGFAVDLYLTINDGVDISTLAAKFGVTTSSNDGTNFTNVFIADDPSGQKLTVSENNTTLFQFGCFNVTQTFTEAGILSGTYGLTPDGVINASNHIMSLLGVDPLWFENDDMAGGTKQLLSFSVPECASLGVPNGVGDSDGTYILMEALALGGGEITLHTFYSNGDEFHSEPTTWDALLN